MRENVIGMFGGVAILDRRSNTAIRPSPDAIMSMWTIYKDTSDYPGKYVIRRSEVLTNLRVAQTGDMSVHESLTGARKAIPQGKHNIGRQPADDSVIVESWV